MTTTPLVIQARIEDALTPGLKKQAEAMNVLRNEIDDVTDQLKLFGERGNQMANALEEIGDPLERVRLGQQYLNREMAGSGGQFGKLNDAAARLKVEWESLGTAGQGLITGIIAASTAVTAAAAKLAQVVVEYGAAAWKEYAKTNADAKAALEDFDKAVSASNVTIGKNIEQYLRVTDTIAGMTTGIEDATAALNKSEGQLSDTIAAYKDMVTVVPVLNTVVDLTDKLATSIANVGAESRKASRESDKFYRDLGGRYSEDIEQNAESFFRLRDARMKAIAGRERKAEETAIGSTLAAEGLVEVEAAKELNKQGAGRLAIYKQVDAAVASIEAREARILDLVGKSVATARETGTRFGKVDVEQFAGKELRQIEDAAKKFEELRLAADIDAGKQLQTKAFADAAAVSEPWIAATTAIQNGFIGIGTAAITMGIMVTQGTATLGDMGRAFADQLGGLFVQVGSGLAAAGFGELALFSGDPAGAIAWGIGLAAIGAAIQGFAAEGPKKKKSAPAASDGGARLAQIADRVLGTQDDRQERSFAVYISEEAFGDAVIRATNKGNARGRLGRQALPAGFIGGG